MEFRLTTWGIGYLHPPKAAVVMPLSVLDPVVDLPEERGQEIQTTSIPPDVDTVAAPVIRCSNCGRLGGLARMDGSLIPIAEGLAKLFRQGWRPIQDQVWCPHCAEQVASDNKGIAHPETMC